MCCKCLECKEPIDPDNGERYHDTDGSTYWVCYVCAGLALPCPDCGTHNLSVTNCGDYFCEVCNVPNQPQKS